MEPAERETIILINDADLEDGFFRISTTKKAVYDSLLEKIGPDDVVFTKVTLSTNLRFSEGTIHCRSSRLGSPLFIVKHKRSPYVSDLQRAANERGAARLKAMNLAKKLEKEKNNAR